MKRLTPSHLYLAAIAGLIAGAILGAGVSLHVHKGVLEAANRRGDICVEQLASYNADTKAKIHDQIQTLSKKYMVLNQDVFIDVLNSSVVDLEKEYHNLYSGQQPID